MDCYAQKIHIEQKHVEMNLKLFRHYLDF